MNLTRSTPELKFHTDWFDVHIPIWEKCLGSMSGKADLRFLEVGSFEGRSACWLLQNILTHDSARLTCVDIGLESYGPDQYRYCQSEFNPLESLRWNLDVLGVPHKVHFLRAVSQDVMG